MVKSESKKPNSSKNILSSVKKEIFEGSISAGENTFTVLKRNGTIVPFRKERIFKAIESALRDTKKISKETPLPEELNTLATDVTHQVLEQLFTLASKNVSLTVEGIQDLVEVTLMKNGLHDVARDYIIYRDHHKEMRSDDPRNIKIVRRDSETPVRFNPIKVAASIEKIFRRLNHIEGQTPDDIVSIVNTLSQQVVGDAVHLAKTDELHIHHIQNLIEEALMGAGYFQAAKDYILYRAEKGQQTGATAPAPKTRKRRKAKDGERKFTFQGNDGVEKTISETELLDRLDHACRGFEKLAKPEELLESAILNFYEGIKEDEI
ncbi:MAG: ribonucleoside-diphosphate reductase subunit alpha, partial [Simkaniaceae bacterium]|nr:ribonucleoside-diphosphate reductase subunit alpha [Simkaniaceae bacterium]